MQIKMISPDDIEDINDEKPTLQQIHEEGTRLQRVLQEQRQAGRRYYFSSGKEEEKQKLLQRAEGCQNLQRAKTMASATLSDLSKGCNANSASCILCEILLRAVQSSIPENELSPNGIMNWPSFKWYEPTWSISGNQDKDHQRQIELFSKEGDQAILDCPRGTFVPNSSKSEESIDQVRYWLMNCRCSSGHTSLLPNRVIDIRDHASIRLRESRGLYGRYACLSHCWGQLQANGTLVTSRVSYNAHVEDGIRFASLPKLFQDVVELAQALDIPYLWIDALCIIQGDEDDWREESAKMKDVYRNSYLNFAATSAKDSHGSCVSQLLPHFKAQYISNGVYCRQRIPHFEDSYNTSIATRYPKPDLSRFPLIERGWVYQERLLAPRVVHLTAQEIVWECGEGTICQCSDTQKAYSVTEGDTKVDHAISLEFGDTDMKKRWRTVVEEYSSLSLTFEKDCLPALAGLAKQFYEQRSDDNYLAGLWRQTLFEDMLWTASPGPSERPYTWRAPTWSWASVKGSIRY
ncbi:heterokaryon incompatibility protein-domain-containing protein, partial [Pyrenochaeta sp. MPI-SDFR-AT-0127]